ncbi:restriction endonuclease subunit S [Companilactobacillus sp. HBUAS56257]|uniref:restriction endonuclease subunit S n=1 Tax=Companilactobacillus sp. HBUAS56257 TaxID=3109360 RepID=UPI002FEED202
MSNKVPQIRFNGYSDAWVQQSFFEIVARISKSSNSKNLPKLEYEDINSGYGTLNKDISEKFDNRKGIVFEKNDILFGKLRPYLKNWFFSNFKGIALGDFWVLRSKKDPPFFIYYLIQSPSFQKIANDTSGTKMPRSDWKRVSKAVFFIPNINEQVKIGKILSLVDNLITLQQRQLDLYTKLKKGLLQKLFPKDGAKVPELRFAGFADDWEERKLGELSNIVGGGTPSTSNSEYWDGDIDWYAPAEIGEQRYVSKSKKTITELGLKKSSARILPVGTVLFTSRAGIGNTAILGKEATTNQGFQSIVPNPNKLDSYFIYSRTNELKRYGEVTGAGSTFVEVSGKQMSKMSIMVPELSEQKKIGSFFEQLDNTIALHQRKLDLLKEQKKGFLQNMFV